MPLSYPPATIFHGYASRKAAVSMLAVGLCAPMTTFAGEPDDDGSTSWALGLGVMSEQEPYTDIDRENTPVPLLEVENRYIHLFGPQIEFKLPSVDINDSQALNFGIVAEYDESGYEEGDADILDDMSDRDGGLWAGAKMEWESELFEVSAEWLADATGDSNGQRFNLGLERTWQFGEHVMLTPRLGATWHDDKYIDYYFGVRDSEARIGRPAYSGESGVSTELGVRGVYQFNSRHSVLMDAEVTSLPDEIKDSPLVDRSTTNAVFVGYIYSF